MSTIDRILTLAKEKGIKQSFLNNLIGGYRGKITDWKNGKSSPSNKDLEIIAEFFGVSTDYLLGKTDDPITPTKEQKDEFAELLQDCSVSEQELIKNYIRFVKSQRGK